MTGLDLVWLGGIAEKTGVVDECLTQFDGLFSMEKDAEKLEEFEDGDRFNKELAEGDEEWR